MGGAAECTRQGRFSARRFPESGAEELFRLGVCLVVNGQQVGQGDLRVFLGSRELNVAKEFLDGAEVGSVAEEVSGVGVAQLLLWR